MATINLGPTVNVMPTPKQEYQSQLFKFSILPAEWKTLIDSVTCDVEYFSGIY